MKIMILNKVDAINLYPLAKLLSNTGKSIGNFCGIDIYSNDDILRYESVLKDKNDFLKLIVKKSRKDRIRKTKSKN